MGDLSQAKFGAWLNQMGFERARQASVNNVRLMSILTQQFNVPLSKSRDAAEELLGAELICTLGGEYEFDERKSGPTWRSTAWPISQAYAVPDDYITPILQWFRGLEGHLLKDESGLSIHARVDLQRK